MRGCCWWLAGWVKIARTLPSALGGVLERRNSSKLQIFLLFSLNFAPKSIELWQSYTRARLGPSLFHARDAIVFPLLYPHKREAWHLPSPLPKAVEFEVAECWTAGPGTYVSRC